MTFSAAYRGHVLIVTGKLYLLAEIANMNSNFFYRFFKELTQETPMEYITRYSIEKSCELLISGENLTDTAYNCGFNDTSYYINVFKKHMAVSPKQYQFKHTGI